MPTIQSATFPLLPSHSPTATPQIALLMSASERSHNANRLRLPAFLWELELRGWAKWTGQVDGRNVRIDRRWPIMTSIEMLMLPKELVGPQPDAIFASVVLSPSNHEKEEEHAQAAGFPFRRDVGGCGYDTRRGARRDARSEVGQ